MKMVLKMAVDTKHLLARFVAERSNNIGWPVEFGWIKSNWLVVYL